MTACTPTPVEPNLPDAATTPWPMGDRLPDDALPREVDAKALQAALDWALDDSQRPAAVRTRGLVVLYKGRLIGERYAPGFDSQTRHISWSAGKSITAALIGLLVRDGLVGLDDYAPIAELSGQVYRDRYAYTKRIGQAGPVVPVAAG